MKFIRKFDLYISTLYLVTIAVILMTAYFTFKEVINSYSKNQHQSIIPLFSIINTEVVRPLNVAFFLANDPLLVDFVEQDTIDKQELLFYLKRLSDRYNMLTFVALEKHDLMLDSNGKTLSLNHEKAEWYHRLKKVEKDQISDIGNADDPHLYFDVKLYNNRQEFIGFTGVAIDLNHFAKRFREYQQRFGFELIFADQNNDITLSSNHLMKTESHHRKDALINISQLPWYKQLLAQESVYDISKTVVAIDDGERVISQMPIPALNWRLFIFTPPASEQSEYWQLLLTRLGLFFSVMLVLYYCFTIILNYFTKRLVADSETDFLTKLPNRSYMNWKFEELASSAQQMCLVMADIDHFKKINDKYGHVVGDEVLKEVAHQLNKNLRHDDVSGRWGGEEFLMLLPNTDGKRAHEIVERIRASIAQFTFSVSSSNETFNITISFGISHYAQSDADLDEMLLQADKALYHAKSQGRNRTELYVKAE